MLNTLIVDDERLVRKGLISTMPWDKYDIRIVGEAGNGRAALDFMQQHKVDLLFVDLTMPTMSGFELMKAVRDQHPKTWIVVLTCHQDFEYIQEAMRAGAIDYIVKTQLEKECMDDMLARIVQRIQFDDTNKVAEMGISKMKTEDRPIYLLALMSSKKELDPASDLMKAGIFSVTPLGVQIWSVACMDDEIESPLSRYVTQSNDYVLIKVNGKSNDYVLIKVNGKSELSVVSIRTYLFYEYEPNRKVYELTLMPAKSLDKQILDEPKLLDEVWFSFRWLYEEEGWQSLIALIEHTKPESLYLSELLHTSVRLWREIFRGGEMDVYDSIFESLVSWTVFKQMLFEIRCAIQERMKSFAYYDEIIITVLKALYYMLELEDLRVNRDMVAATFNISSGYFSECFKTIIGRSFGEYMKELQIEKAKRLLVETKYPIYRIAERTGYKDEKYFSRVFRERAGLNPAEYRKANEGSVDTK